MVSRGRAARAKKHSFRPGAARRSGRCWRPAAARNRPGTCTPDCILSPKNTVRAPAAWLVAVIYGPRRRAGVQVSRATSRADAIPAPPAALPLTCWPGGPPSGPGNARRRRKLGFAGWPPKPAPLMRPPSRSLLKVRQVRAPCGGVAYHLRPWPFVRLWPFGVTWRRGRGCVTAGGG